MVMDPTTSPPPPGAAAWLGFWQQAGVDGCTAALPPAVAASIAAGWHTLFAGLACTASHLDVACGRGAVLGHARARGLSSVIGVDLVAPPAADPAIRGGIDAASLPFADASFDVVTSQFGVEYAGLAAAGQQAARVARQNLWLLLHAAEGPIAAQAREQMDQLAWLHADADAAGIFARHAAAPGPATAAALGGLRDALVNRAETATNASLLEGLWMVAGDALAGQPVPDIGAELAAYAARLHLMAGAAPTAAETAALADALRSAGWQVSLRDEGAGPVARWLIATRR